MKEITIYTTEVCPYCIRAKKLLEKKGVPYKELNVDKNPELVEVVIQKSGGRTTVPQIFIGDFHVGGFDDLNALENENKLDELLNA